MEIWEGTGWAGENTILRRSAMGDMSVDTYRLKGALQATSGLYRLRLRENDDELTTLDQVRLMAVHHPLGESAFLVGDSPVLGHKVPAHRVRTTRGADVTALVNGSGSEHFSGMPGDTLLVEMVSGAWPQGLSGRDPPPARQSSSAGAIRPHPEGRTPSADELILSSSGILIQTADGAGPWRTVQHRYPRQSFDEFLVDSLGDGPMRLAFLGRHDLRFVGRVERSPTAGVAVEQELVRARHSRLGDVLAQVSGGEENSTVITPSDTLNLEFAASSVPDGQTRTLFLISRGVYTSVRPGRQEQSERSLPTRFALAQNQPNPFARTTMIRFDLPVAVKVKLEVFDPQGRRIRVLAEGQFEPGYHAVPWDRRSATGGAVRPGVYIYRIHAGSFWGYRKMVVLP